MNHSSTHMSLLTYALFASPPVPTSPGIQSTHLPQSFLGHDSDFRRLHFFLFPFLELKGENFLESQRYIWGTRTCFDEYCPASSAS